jgi:ribosomal protein S18 acetylase RimI-like enzyme
MANVSRKDVSIRPLKEGELDAMRKLWKAAGLPYRPRGRDSLMNLQKQRAKAPGFFLGAFKNGQLIAVSLVTDDGRKGWINRLAVRPDARRKGVATLLVRESEAALRRRGMRLICANIEVGNDVSFALFEKLGYHIEKEILYLTKRDSEFY